MKNSYIPLFLLTLCFPLWTQAGTVQKCVDSNGKITYTDKGCKGKEKVEDTYLMGNQNTAKDEKNYTVSYKVQEIGLLTEEAINQCISKAEQFFADTRPAVKSKTVTEFEKVVDRSIRGAEVEIVLSGVIRYGEEQQKQEMPIQCTATKRRENNDWTLVFK